MFWQQNLKEGIMDFYTMMLFIGIVLLPLVLLGVSCSLSIPKAMESCQKLQCFHQPSTFTEAVGWSVISLSFLSVVYIVWLRFAMVYEAQVESQLFKLILSGALLVFIFYFLIPNTYSFFKRWRLSKKAADFSLSIFFGFLSLVALSFIYLRVLFCVQGISSVNL